MATYRVQGPDGAVHKFEGPDDATPEEVEAAAEAQFGGAVQTQAPAADATATPPIASVADTSTAPPVAAEAAPKTWKKKLSPAAQAILAGGSGAIAQPLAGLAGIAALPFSGASGATDIINKIQNKLTFEPESELANSALRAVSYLPEKFAQGTEWVGGKAGGDLGAMIGRVGGEALPALLPMVKMARGAKPVAPELAALRARTRAARIAGYKVPPAMAGETGFIPELQGAAGKIKTQQQASIANQVVTDNLIKKDLGIPKDAIITPDILKGIRGEAGKHYEAIQTLPGKFKTTDPYIDGLFAVGKELRELAKEFPSQAATYRKDIKPLINSLAKPDMTPANAIRLSKQLRFDGEANLLNRENPAKLTLGTAQKTAAKLIEDMVESNLETLGKPELLTNFKNARQTIAKTYAAEKAMNETTGTVDAGKLGSRLKAGKPITGGMRQAAEFARSFPKAAQVPEVIGGVTHFSPLDVATAAISAGSGTLSGLAAGLGMVGRPITRNYILSDAYQMGQGRPKGPLSEFGKTYAPLSIPGLLEREKP